MQVFKLLVRSCRRWQLKFCNQFYELFAARHAPRVSLPTSNPGRPRGLSATILQYFSARVCLLRCAGDQRDRVEKRTQHGRRSIETVPDLPYTLAAASRWKL